MRILIVDDDQSKTAAISEYLKERGILDSSIEYAVTVTSAKKLLRHTKFDIMLLDLLLPYREDEAPHKENGLKLLRELNERGRYKEPSMTVGITQYKDVEKEYKTDIEKYFVHIINYSEIDESWKSRLDDTIEELKRRQGKGTVEINIDLCFVCALKDPEAKQLLSVLGNASQQLVSPRGLEYFEGTLDTGAQQLKYIVTHQNRMGSIASSTHTTRTLMEFNPKVVVMVGICAGVSQDSGIGDIIIGSHLWDWQAGKYTSVDGEAIFMVEPNQIESSPKIERSMRRYINSSDKLRVIYDSWINRKPNRNLRAFMGPVASGSSVIASAEKIQQIRDTQQRKMIGLEMEGYGFYQACREEIYYPLEFIMIKSVSDKADEHKGDNDQDFASYISASFAINFLKDEWHNIID